MTTVLVVEDHAPIAQAITMLLRMSGHQVTVVDSGEAALDHVRDYAVSLLVLDIAMPGISGFEVLRELRATGRLATLPVIVCSATHEHRDEALLAGAVDYVLKHEAEKLPTIIRSIVRRTSAG